MAKTKTRLKTLARLAALTPLVALVATHAAYAYYSSVRNGQRTTWPASAMTHDNGADPDFEGTDLSTLSTAGLTPNDDNLGILLVADASVSSATVNCIDSSTAVGPPAPGSIYRAVYDALGTWDSVSSATVNFAFVCAATDIDITAFDSNTSNANLEIWNTATDSPILNGFNEIVFDDTATGQIVTALNLGLDPNTLLGLSFPFDTGGDLIVDTASSGVISEAFILINLLSGPSATDIQAIATHETGHLLGLGHTTAVLNIVGGDDTKVPTMYFAGITDLTQILSLEADDLAGITLSYPAAGEPFLTFGAISGSVMGSFGFTFEGAAIIAQETGGSEVSVIVGGDPDLAATEYFLVAPPGSYTVRLTSMDGSSAAGFVNTGSNGNIDAIFTTPALDFETNFFDGVTDEGSATPVTVALGSETSGIDFIIETGSNTGGLFGQVLSDPDGCQASGAASPGFSPALLLAVLWLIQRRREARR